MSTRREFLQQASFMSMMGGFGLLPDRVVAAVNDKEKPPCSDIELPTASGIRINSIKKSFEFPDAMVTVELGQIMSGEKPGHRFYQSSTVSLCGEVDDMSFCDLDDPAHLYSLGWMETDGKRHSMVRDEEEVFQRRVALNHIEQLCDMVFHRSCDGWGATPRDTPALAELYEFLDMLHTAIEELSEPDCIREEPWTTPTEQEQMEFAEVPTNRPIRGLTGIDHGPGNGYTVGDQEQLKRIARASL